MKNTWSKQVEKIKHKNKLQVLKMHSLKPMILSMLYTIKFHSGYLGFCI